MSKIKYLCSFYKKRPYENWSVLIQRIWGGRDGSWLSSLDRTRINRQHPSQVLASTNTSNPSWQLQALVNYDPNNQSSRFGGSNHLESLCNSCSPWAPPSLLN